MSDHGAKAGKEGESKKLTKAEMNTKLFDDQREFSVCVPSVFYSMSIW